MEHQSVADIARATFRYDPDTGRLFRKTPTGEREHYMVNAKGYLMVSLNGQMRPVHRVAWLIVHGYWPNVIDHIDGDRKNNRFINLRNVTTAINNQNRRKPSVRNKTGVLGVCPDPKMAGRFRAQIRAQGKKLHLGSFPTVEEAQAAYIEAKRKYHPECLQW